VISFGVVPRSQIGRTLRSSRKHLPDRRKPGCFGRCPEEYPPKTHHSALARRDGGLLMSSTAFYRTWAASTVLSRFWGLESQKATSSDTAITPHSAASDPARRGTDPTTFCDQPRQNMCRQYANRREHATWLAANHAPTSNRSVSRQIVPYGRMMTKKKKKGEKCRLGHPKGILRP